MPISYQKFFPPTVIPTAITSVYQVPVTPASSLLRGARVRITNSTASAKTARLYAVPSGDVPADGNAFFFDSTIPALGFVDVDVPILAAGDTLQASASTNPGLNIQAITGGVFSA